MKLTSLLLAAGLLAVAPPVSAQEAPKTGSAGGAEDASADGAASGSAASSSPASSSASSDASQGDSVGAANSAEGSVARSPTPSSAMGTPAYYRYRGMSDETLAYEYERTTLGGPVALTVVGGVVSALALPTLLVSGLGSIVCHVNVPETGNDCTAVDVVAVASGISTAAFGAMTVVGVVLLDQRSRKRKEIKQELWRREAERSSIELGLRPLFGGSMLTLTGRF